MVQKLVIVGGGWAGYTLAHEIDDKKFEVIVVSPEPTTPYTPLLASAACGLFNFSLAEEPIRHKSRAVRYIQARVTDIDFQKQVCCCLPAFQASNDGPNDLVERSFELSYDHVVIAPGCISQTFGTPSVAENAFFVKNVHDAMAIRSRLSDILEMASLLTATEEEQRALLHIVIVGGGPTGVEISAELIDLIHDDLEIMYPDLKGKFSLAIHDVAPPILGTFDQKLAEHAQASFRKSGVEMKTGSHITRVEPGVLHTAEDGSIRYGMLIWATGNKQTPLTDTLSVRKSDKGLRRILTDEYLRPLDSAGEAIVNAFAIGDASMIVDHPLPTTAEVATQMGSYVAKILNGKISTPFPIKSVGIIACTGNHDGVIHGERDWSGPIAWLAWRQKNLSWSRSWRNKILITMNWSLDHIFGKEMARA